MNVKNLIKSCTFKFSLFGLITMLISLFTNSPEAFLGAFNLPLYYILYKLKFILCTSQNPVPHNYIYFKELIIYCIVYILSFIFYGFCLDFIVRIIRKNADDNTNIPFFHL
jgi:hypothetical protein